MSRDDPRDTSGRGRLDPNTYEHGSTLNYSRGHAGYHDDDGDEMMADVGVDVDYLDFGANQRAVEAQRRVSQPVGYQSTRTSRYHGGQRSERDERGERSEYAGTRRPYEYDNDPNQHEPVLPTQSTALVRHTYAPNPDVELEVGGYRPRGEDLERQQSSRGGYNPNADPPYPRGRTNLSRESAQHVNRTQETPIRSQRPSIVQERPPRNPATRSEVDYGQALPTRSSAVRSISDQQQPPYGQQAPTRGGQLPDDHPFKPRTNPRTSEYQPPSDPSTSAHLESRYSSEVPAPASRPPRIPGRTRSYHTHGTQNAESAPHFTTWVSTPSRGSGTRSSQYADQRLPRQHPNEEPVSYSSNPRRPLPEDPEVLVHPSRRRYPSQRRENQSSSHRHSLQPEEPEVTPRSPYQRSSNQHQPQAQGPNTHALSQRSSNPRQSLPEDLEVAGHSPYQRSPRHRRENQEDDDPRNKWPQVTVLGLSQDMLVNNRVDTGNETGHHLISRDTVYALGYKSDNIKPDRVELDTLGGSVLTMGSIHLKCLIRLDQDDTEKVHEDEFLIFDKSYTRIKYDLIFCPEADRGLRHRNQKSLMMVVLGGNMSEGASQHSKHWICICFNHLTRILTLRD